MIRVLITSMGSNTSIGIAKSLRLNKQFYIVGTDINEEKNCAGSYFVDKFYKIQLYNSAEYSMSLFEIINREKIDCVIPVLDGEIEVISKLMEMQSNLTNWAVNSLDTILLCNNKLEINHFTDELEIPVPKTFRSKKEFVFPLIKKPKKGVSSRGLSIYKEIDESLLFDEEYLYQSFVEGTEYTVDCYSSYLNQEFKCSIRERLETKAGISTKGKIVRNELIEDYCYRIHSVLNYKGASNIQFIIENNVPYFIEINPRFAGGGVLSYMNGFNLPEITVLELVEKNAQALAESKVAIGRSMVRYWEEFFYG